MTLQDMSLVEAVIFSAFTLLVWLALFVLYLYVFNWLISKLAQIFEHKHINSEQDNTYETH